MSQSYFPTRLLMWGWLEVQWSQCIDLISTLVHMAKFRNIFICRAPIEFHRKEADGYFWRLEMKIMLSVDKHGKIDTFILLIWILMNIWLVWFWPLVISFPFFLTLQKSTKSRNSSRPWIRGWGQTIPNRSSVYQHWYCLLEPAETREGKWKRRGFDRDWEKFSKSSTWMEHGQ